MATSASLMPAITVPAPPAAGFRARSKKARMMPSTVPKRPTKGALFPSVPRKREPALVVDPPALDRPGDHLAHRLRALAGVLDRRAHDGGLEPFAPLDRGGGAGEVAREQPALARRRRVRSRRARKNAARSIMTPIETIERTTRSHSTHSAPRFVRARMRFEIMGAPVETP